MKATFTEVFSFSSGIHGMSVDGQNKEQMFVLKTNMPQMLVFSRCYSAASLSQPFSFNFPMK